MINAIRTQNNYFSTPAVSTQSPQDEDNFILNALSTIATLVPMAALPFAAARLFSDRGFRTEKDDPKYWEKEIFVHEARGEMEEAAKARIAYAKLMITYRRRDTAVEQYLTVANAVTYPPKLRIEAIDQLIDSLKLNWRSEIPHILALNDMRIGLYHEMGKYTQEITVRRIRANLLIAKGDLVKAAEEYRTIVRRFEDDLIKPHPIREKMFNIYIESILDMGRVLEAGGNYFGARLCYNKAWVVLENHDRDGDHLKDAWDHADAKSRIARRLKRDNVDWSALSESEKKEMIKTARKEHPYGDASENESVYDDVKTRPDPGMESFSDTHEIDWIRQHESDADSYRIREKYFQEAFSRAALAEQLKAVGRYEEAAIAYQDIFEILDNQPDHAEENHYLREMEKLAGSKTPTTWAISMRIDALYKGKHQGSLLKISEWLSELDAELYLKARVLYTKLYEREGHYIIARHEYNDIEEDLKKLGRRDLLSRLAVEMTPALLRTTVEKILDEKSTLWKELGRAHHEALLDIVFSRLFGGQQPTLPDEPVDKKVLEHAAHLLARRINNDLSLAEIVAKGVAEPPHPERPELSFSELVECARETGGRIRKARERVEGKGKKKGR